MPESKDHCPSSAAPCGPLLSTWPSHPQTTLPRSSLDWQSPPRLAPSADSDGYTQLETRGMGHVPVQLCGTATAVLFTQLLVLARAVLSWRGGGWGPETGDEDVSEVLRNPAELQVWSTSGPVWSGLWDILLALLLGHRVWPHPSLLIGESRVLTSPFENCPCLPLPGPPTHHLTPTDAADFAASWAWEAHSLTFNNKISPGLRSPPTILHFLSL